MLVVMGIRPRTFPDPVKYHDVAFYSTRLSLFTSINALDRDRLYLMHVDNRDECGCLYT